MEWLEQAAQLTVVLGFLGGLLGGLFNYTIIRPLKVSLDNLRDLIEELRRDKKTLEERTHLLELAITEIKAQIKSNTHRIDVLEVKAHDVGHG